MAKWTPERDRDLTLLVDEGLTCARIADRLSEMHNDEFTKNSVIGRARRLCLVHARAPGPNENSGHRKRRLATRGENAHIVRNLRKLKEQMAEPAPIFRTLPVAEVSDRDIASPLYLTIMELERDNCRWPYGEGDFRFCGRQTKEGSAYCDHHSQLAFDGKTRKPVHVPERLLGKRAA